MVTAPSGLDSSVPNLARRFDTPRARCMDEIAPGGVGSDSLDVNGTMRPTLAEGIGPIKHLPVLKWR
jgi:hypothetical protein